MPRLRMGTGHLLDPHLLNAYLLFCFFCCLGVLGACRRAPRHNRAIAGRADKATPPNTARLAPDPALAGSLPAPSIPPREIQDTRIFTPKNRTGPPCRLIQMLSPMDLHIQSIDPNQISDHVNQVFPTVEQTLADDKTPRDVSVQVLYQRDRAPDLYVSTRPPLSPEAMHTLLARLSALKPYHPKQLAYPVIYRTCLHGGATDQKQPFRPELPPPYHRAAKRLAALSLSQQLQSIRGWAWEVIPIVATSLHSVDLKFEGVRALGATLARLKPGARVDADELTFKNWSFWRALLEMAPRREIVPAVRTLLLIANGRLDGARHLARSHVHLADPASLSGYLFAEMLWRFYSFAQTLHARIVDGVKAHDAKRYREALAIYDRILRDYPDSGLTLWEHYFSTRLMHLAERSPTWDSHKEWLKVRPRIYAADPLFQIYGSATNSREGYEALRRLELKELFQTQNLVPDLLKQADIAVDLGLYGFAALVYYGVAKNIKPASYQNRKLYVDFLYALGKLDMPLFKDHFDFDHHTAAFRAIDATRHERFVKNPFYDQYCDRGDGAPPKPSCKRNKKITLELTDNPSGPGWRLLERHKPTPRPRTQ